MTMKLSDMLLAELDREVPRSRRALQEVPSGKYEWKPHDKSMTLGPLAQMVATILSEGEESVGRGGSSEGEESVGRGGSDNGSSVNHRP